MGSPPSHDNDIAITTDHFHTPTLLIPYKDSPIVSLRALEDGDDHFEHVELTRSNVWTRLLMTLRRRHGNSTHDHQRLTLLGHDEDAVERKRDRRKKVWSRVLMALPVAVLCLFGITHIVNVFLAYIHPLFDDKDVSVLPAWNPSAGLVYDSATLGNLTRNVVPIPCHSHNDYWRTIPLYEALRYGCTGVEADVWLFDNQAKEKELFVGHSTNALQTDRTFRSMYVDPLVQLLEQQNAMNAFTRSEDNSPKNGVFQMAPAQSLVLLVDFKNNGRDIYPAVSSQLSALRERDYLTYFDGESMHVGPITVVATGNAPFDLITADGHYRDIFFDAPLDRLYQKPDTANSYYDMLQRPNGQPGHVTASKRDGQGTVGTDKDSHFDHTNSYYASVSFSRSIGTVWLGRLSAKQLDRIRGQIQGAKKRGLKARYWATPKWPISLRNHIWEVLIEEGADYLNGDDLRSMTRVDWSAKRHHGWLGG